MLQLPCQEWPRWQIWCFYLMSAKKAVPKPSMDKAWHQLTGKSGFHVSPQSSNAPSVSRANVKIPPPAPKIQWLFTFQGHICRPWGNFPDLWGNKKQEQEPERSASAQVPGSWLVGFRYCLECSTCMQLYGISVCKVWAYLYKRPTLAQGHGNQGSLFLTMSTKSMKLPTSFFFPISKKVCLFTQAWG